MTSSVEIAKASEVDRLRRLARALDSALRIPGTNYRFGFDAVIGLIPGIGDAIGAIFSVFIVFRSARLGAPKSTLVRMMTNIGIDAVVGVIPVLGDMFDVGWQANNRNLALLQQHLEHPALGLRSSRRTLLLIGLGLLLILAGVIALGVWVFSLTVLRMH